MTDASLHRRALLGAGALGLALAAVPRARAAAGGVLAVMEKGEGALAFYDLDTGRLAERVGLGPYPHEFAVDRARTLAYVAHYGAKSSDEAGDGGTEVFTVDLAARRRGRSLDCRPFNRLHGIRMDARDRLHVLSEARDVLLGIDAPATQAHPVRAVTTGGIKGHLFALTGDGAHAYVSNILSNTVTEVRPFAPSLPPRSVETGLWPEGSALSRDEASLYVANRKSATLSVVDTGAMRVTRTLPTRGDVVRVALLPDGGLALANFEEKSLSLWRPDLSEAAVVPLCAAPVAIALHPDAPTAFVSLMNDRVALVDLARAAVVREIATGREPDVAVLLPG